MHQYPGNRGKQTTDKIKPQHKKYLSNRPLIFLANTPHPHFRDWLD